MEKQVVKKVITVCFLSAAVLTYLAVNTLFKSLAGAFGIVQRWYSVELINHGLPVLTATVLFLVLQLNPKIVNWAEEVVLEVSKVVWPSRKNTIGMTGVVCLFVGFASVVLWIIDSIARQLVGLVLH